MFGRISYGIISLLLFTSLSALLPTDECSSFSASTCLDILGSCKAGATTCANDACFISTYNPLPSDCAAGCVYKPFYAGDEDAGYAEWSSCISESYVDTYNPCYPLSPTLKEGSEAECNHYSQYCEVKTITTTDNQNVKVCVKKPEVIYCSSFTTSDCAKVLGSCKVAGTTCVEDTCFTGTGLLPGASCPPGCVAKAFHMKDEDDGSYLEWNECVNQTNADTYNPCAILSPYVHGGSEAACNHYSQDCEVQSITRTNGQALKICVKKPEEVVCSSFSTTNCAKLYGPCKVAGSACDDDTCLVGNAPSPGATSCVTGCVLKPFHFKDDDGSYTEWNNCVNQTNADTYNPCAAVSPYLQEGSEAECTHYSADCEVQSITTTSGQAVKICAKKGGGGGGGGGSNNEGDDDSAFAVRGHFAAVLVLALLLLHSLL